MSSSKVPDPPTSQPRVLRPRRAAPADAVRPTRAEINLEALRKNLHVLQRHAKGSKIWAVLKADGYGHGAPAVARTLERAGADGFCVALLEEGVELREAGITAPILVMGGYYGHAHEEVLARKLMPVVCDMGQVEGFSRLVKSGAVDGPVDVHLKIDTGMARLGVTLAELPAFADRLKDVTEVRVVALMTHLACAETAEETSHQIVRFDDAAHILSRQGIRPSVRHAANTAAVLRGDARLDAVRPGIGVFGVGEDLSLVMRVRTEVVSLRQISKGTPVGYGSLWRAPEQRTIATIPMGYADGLSRQLTNKGHVLIRGKRAPIVGAVSMDMSMVDVTAIEGVSMRDEAVVLGAQEGPLGKDCITPDEVAAHAGTIAWEVLTSISRRVPRFYREP